MVGTDGFVQAYNAQLTVDEGRQLIVACGVSNQPPDVRHQVLERVREGVGAVPEHMTGDTDRGLVAVNAEWELVSLCHNLLKLFGQRALATKAP